MNASEWKLVRNLIGRATPKQLESIELWIKGLEYDHYRSDDSPKGENVPGVRHRAG